MPSGVSVGRSEARPEQILGQYDIVFAKARCALEALACGTALIACDAAGLGGMVTPGNYEKFRALNFGIRTLRDSITVETITRELDRYDAIGAREKLAQRAAHRKPPWRRAIDQILDVYQEAIDAQLSRISDETPENAYSIQCPFPGCKRLPPSDCGFHQGSLSSRAGAQSSKRRSNGAALPRG